MRRESNARVTDDNWPVLPETIITGESASHYVAPRTTRHGYVHINAVRYGDGTELTNMFFVWHGREHYRSFDKFYGLRWVTRLAEAFVREVVGECRK